MRLRCSADLTASNGDPPLQRTYPTVSSRWAWRRPRCHSNFAGGSAREGFLPFIHTFAVFIYRRAYDQMAMSVAYPNLPVRMFGFLPGITSPGGASHQASKTWR